MRLLLDTHTLLWALMEPRRLGARVRPLLADRGSELLVSSATAWELSTKYRLGRLPEAGAALDGYADHLRVLGAEDLPVTAAHALTAGAFDVDHRDPFDRVIAAQALLLGVPVVTKDRALRQLPCTCLW